MNLKLMSMVELDELAHASLNELVREAARKELLQRERQLSRGRNNNIRGALNHCRADYILS